MGWSLVIRPTGDVLDFEFEIEIYRNMDKNTDVVTSHLVSEKAFSIATGYSISPIQS